MDEEYTTEAAGMVGTAMYVKIQEEKASLELLTDNLVYRYPKAADSLREGFG